MKQDPVETENKPWKITGNESLKVVRIENEFLQLTVLPAFGGKILELINKQTGTQFLYEPSEDPKSLRLPRYGEVFQPPYSFGFDECFPNITAESCHMNGHIAELPDHGEIWSRECDVHVSGDELILISRGVEINYQFVKRISLIQNRVKINYQLVNEGGFPFHYIWSTHPLLAVDEGDQLLLSEKSRDILLNWSSDEHLGKEGTTLSWPQINGNGESGLSFVKNIKKKTAAKLFADSGTGRAGLYRKKSDETLMFHVDPGSIPYLGIWLCYGGWPEDSKQGDFTVAIEPTLAEFDSLNRAKEKGQAPEIKPGETHSWQLEISIESGLKKP